MSDITKDALLNARLAHRKAGRAFIAPEGPAWGELILPAPEEAQQQPNQNDFPDALRLVVVASYTMGYLALETLKLFQSRFPERLQVLALLTDDPVNPDAKISLAKRYWHFLTPERCLEIEVALIESALSFGLPVYSGAIKTDWFHRQLRTWAPDAILCCGYGQLLDRTILEQPPLGVYNLHPSDLAAGIGVGPAPFEEPMSLGPRHQRLDAPPHGRSPRPRPGTGHLPALCPAR